MLSEKDPGIFARIGVASPNLKIVRSFTTSNFPSFSTTSFGGLFAQPKPKLKYLDVFAGIQSTVRRGDDISVVLNVLADKVDSLESFTCSGTRLALESLQRFLLSQKKLQKIRLNCFGWAGAKGGIGVRVRRTERTWDLLGFQLCLLASKIEVWWK